MRKKWTGLTAFFLAFLLAFQPVYAKTREQIQQEREEKRAGAAKYPEQI